MWTTKAIIGWLTELGVTGYMVNGTGDIPEMPDLMTVVTPVGGRGLRMEGVADHSGFQLRVVGPQNDPDSAEDVALVADKLILNARVPRTIGTTRLVSVSRQGGRPVALGKPDKGGRTSFVCTYSTLVMEAPE